MAGRRDIKANPKLPTLAVKPEPGDPEGFGPKAKARVSLRPTVQGAFTLQQLHKQTMGDNDLSELVGALADQAKRVSDGSLERPEAMLMTQATTLDALFHNLTRRAMSAEYMNQYEAYLRLGLKAQAQARATIEALGELKNPRPVAFVKQANIANGPQQVNNGVPADGTRARNPETEQTELSGGQRELLPDAGAQSIASGINPAVEAVGALHGATNAGG